MPALQFDHHIAGVRTLWVMQFSASNPESPRQQSVELLVPTPFDKSGWMVVRDKIDPLTLDALIRFERTCEEATARCKEQIASVFNLSNPEDISRLIDNIQKFIKENRAEPPEASK